MVPPTPRTARTEFASALAQVAHERGINPEVILESIKAALTAAFRKDYPQIFNVDWTYEVEMDPISGEYKVFGGAADGKKSDVTPPGFGRIAAQTAKQEILQKIREAEKNAVLGEYEKRLKTLVTGMVLRFDGSNVIVDVGKSEAVMPVQEKVPSENYHINQRLTFYLEDIRETMKGREIIISRASKGLVEALFKREVPEVNNGSVQIKAIAREPGSRTKIAVFSSTPGVDPVGSCVGQKGVRVQAVINDLSGEKVDIIQWSDDPVKFIANSLSPAQGVVVKITSTKKLIALAIVPDDQLSLAIGRDGQNVRLASKLTGYKIDVTGASQANSKTIKPTKKGKKSDDAKDPVEAQEEAITEKVAPEVSKSQEETPVAVSPDKGGS